MPALAAVLDEPGGEAQRLVGAEQQVEPLADDAVEGERAAGLGGGHHPLRLAAPLAVGAGGQAGQRAAAVDRRLEQLGEHHPRPVGLGRGRRRGGQRQRRRPGEGGAGEVDAHRRQGVVAGHRRQGRQLGGGEQGGGHRHPGGQGAFRDGQLHPLRGVDRPPLRPHRRTALDLLGEGEEADVFPAHLEQHLGRPRAGRDDELHRPGGAGCGGPLLGGGEARVVDDQVGRERRLQHLAAAAQHQPLVEIGLDGQAARPGGRAVGGAGHRPRPGAAGGADHRRVEGEVGGQGGDLRRQLDTGERLAVGGRQNRRPGGRVGVGDHHRHRPRARHGDPRPRRLAGRAGDQLGGGQRQPAPGPRLVADGEQLADRRRLLGPGRQRQLDAGGAEGPQALLGQDAAPLLQPRLGRRRRSPAERQEVGEPLAGAAGQPHRHRLRAGEGRGIGGEARPAGRHGSPGHRVERPRRLRHRRHPAVEGHHPGRRLQRQPAVDPGGPRRRRHQDVATRRHLAGEDEAAAAVGHRGGQRRPLLPGNHRSRQRLSGRVEADGGPGQRAAGGIVVGLADEETAGQVAAAGEEDGFEDGGHRVALAVGRRRPHLQAHRTVPPPGVGGGIELHLDRAVAVQAEGPAEEDARDVGVEQADGVAGGPHRQGGRVHRLREDHPHHSGRAIEVSLDHRRRLAVDAHHRRGLGAARPGGRIDRPDGDQVVAGAGHRQGDGEGAGAVGEAGEDQVAVAGLEGRPRRRLAGHLDLVGAEHGRQRVEDRRPAGGRHGDGEPRLGGGGQRVAGDVGDAPAGAEDIGLAGGQRGARGETDRLAGDRLGPHHRLAGRHPGEGQPVGGVERGVADRLREEDQEQAVGVDRGGAVLRHELRHLRRRGVTEQQPAVLRPPPLLIGGAGDDPERPVRRRQADGGAEDDVAPAVGAGRLPGQAVRIEIDPVDRHRRPRLRPGLAGDGDLRRGAGAEAAEVVRGGED